MNELITLNKLNLTKPTFKDERLNKATERITEIYNDALKFADTKNREISKILADVMTNKAYEKDGFKSVAEYANMTFGINRQNAYALATAGKVYNDSKAPDTLKAFSPSKLAELAKVDTKALENALNDGTISADTTQKDLREFAKKAKEEKDKGKGKGKGKAKVVDTYTVSLLPSFKLPKDIVHRWASEHWTIEEWEEGIAGVIATAGPKDKSGQIVTDTVEMVKLPNAHALPDSKKATVRRDLFLSGNRSIVVEYRVYIAKPEAPKKPTAPKKFTETELLKMLEELRAGKKEGK